MKRIIASLLFLAATTVFAEPAPFGLEIGKATVADAEKMYRIEKMSINKDNFTSYIVPVNQVNFDGLKELKLVFNEKGVLAIVTATLPKTQFKSIHESLAKKYKVVSQEIPFVGDSFVQYVNGSTVILLDAPHLNFDMRHELHSKRYAFGCHCAERSKRCREKEVQEDQL